MTMTDNVDFKAAKEWAHQTVADSSACRPETNVARAILALCELLKDALPIVEKATPYTEMYRAKIEARINAAIGA